MIRKILRLILPPVLGILWILLYLSVFNLFLKAPLMGLPVPVRAVLVFPAYWLLALVPLISAIKESYHPFTARKLPLQILTGLAIAALLSAVCTVVPHLLGLGEWVSKNGYTRPWQFVYEMAYCLLAVALVEEWLFRGFLFHRLRILFRSEWVAIGITSVLFGLVHTDGGIVQVLVTAAMGVFFCLCRSKLKYCTLLSLIIAHGVYDWLICLWTFVFS